MTRYAPAEAPPFSMCHPQWLIARGSRSEARGRSDIGRRHGDRGAGSNLHYGVASVSAIAPILEEVGPDYVRERFIGGSDIAGILGISPWASPVTVWQRKTKREEPRDPPSGKRKLYSRGKLWEQVVGEMLVAKLEDEGHTVKVISTNHRYRDPIVPYFAAEIDYEIMLDDIPDPVNVELKTVDPRGAHEWGEEMTDECPLHYAAQAAWGLGITGRKCCIVAPLFGANEISVYPIIRDDETIAGMRERARIFWELYVLPGIAPDPTSLRDVDFLFKEGKETSIVAEPWVVDLLMDYRAASAQAHASNEHCELIEYKIKKYMATCSQLLLPGQDKAAVTWKTQKSMRLNIDALKAAYPKLFREFSKEGTSRVFRVSKFQLGAMSDE
jgi:putative phage-type endonuclease